MKNETGGGGGGSRRGPFFTKRWETCNRSIVSSPFLEKTM